MKLSEIVKNYRIDNALSQDMFSEMCGVSKAYISMIENEKNSKTKKKITPNIESLAKIAKGMGIDLDVLVRMMDKNAVVSLKPPVPEFSKDELELIRRYRKLNKKGKEAALNAVTGLTSIPDYTEKETHLSA